MKPHPTWLAGGFMFMIVGMLFLVASNLDWPTAVQAEKKEPQYKVVLQLPNGCSNSRLLRWTDKETGLVLYMIQNDTGDMWTSMLGFPLEQTLPSFWRKEMGIIDGDKALPFYR